MKRNRLLIAFCKIHMSVFWTNIQTIKMHATWIWFGQSFVSSKIIVCDELFSEKSHEFDLLFFLSSLRRWISWAWWFNLELCCSQCEQATSCSGKITISKRLYSQFAIFIDLLSVQKQNCHLCKQLFCPLLCSP